MSADPEAALPSGIAIRRKSRGRIGCLHRSMTVSHTRRIWSGQASCGWTEQWSSSE